MFDDVAVTEEKDNSNVDAIVEAEETTSETPTFAEQVNDAVKDLVEQEDGSWGLPKDGEYSPELRYAVVSEKRRRDAQSALGKSQHTQKTTELEIKALKNRLTERVELKLSPEQQTEMEELKFSDPDAWRDKMNEFESSASKELETELAEVKTEVTQESELARRKKVLENFNTENPGSQITEDIVANDIPPRITSKLNKGTITFEEFLDEAKNYLGKGKVIANEDLGKAEPNLSKSGGTSTTAKGTVEADIVESYKNEVY